MKVEKCPLDNRWRATSLNSYHNHSLKRKFSIKQTQPCKVPEESKRLFQTRPIANFNLSIELQRDIEKSWFEHGFKRRRIVTHFSKLRLLEKRHVQEHLAHFTPPPFSQVLRLKDFLAKEKETNSKLWYSFDSFQSILCFSLCSQHQKEMFSDILMIDSHHDKGDYNIILFKGVDQHCHTIVLFACITQKYDQSNLVAALENYKAAGFRAPKLLIMDQPLEFLEIFEKFNFKPESYQLC